MIRMTKICIAIACAFGVGTALAQSVLRGDVKAGNAGEATQILAQASTAAPTQTAPAGTAGGTSTGGMLAGVGTANKVGSTIVLVGAAVARTSAASDGSDTPPSR